MNTVAKSPVSAQQPDILLIVCDQLRYDCIGSSRIRPVKTPHLDTMARGGLRFANAFTPQPLCCPARQSLLTSRRPERDGFLWNHDIALKTPSLMPGEKLWPRLLSEAGYRTAYAGKWHESETCDPTAFGYDTYDGDAGYSAYKEELYGHMEYTGGIGGEIDPVATADSHTHWLARQASARLLELAKSDGPWHLRVDFTEPHPPYRPTAGFADMYDPDSIRAWDSFNENFTNKPYIQKQMLYTWGIEDYGWARWAPIVARYFACVSQLDDAVGHIMDALERCGRAGNTLVVLTTDHGDMCGAHRMIDKHNVLYDDIVHVPLLVKWPRLLRADAEISAFVQNTLDIGPTLLEAAGLPAQSNSDGRSLFPLFGGDIPADWRDCAVSTYNGQQFGLYTQRMLRDNDWKYIWNTADTDELYCLREDPAELVNRARDPLCAKTLENMRRRLCDVLTKEGDGLLKSYWMRDQLQGVTKKL